MIGLIMAGGSSTRTNSLEKLSVPKDRPIILRVVDALMQSPQISTIHVAVSKCSPRTYQILQKYDIDVIETRGKGYSVDLSYALDQLLYPVMILPGDLPCIDADIISHMSKLYDEYHWTEILITEKYAAMLRLSPGITITHNDTLCRYTGVSMVKPSRRFSTPTRRIIINDMRIAANLNTPQDWALLDATHNLSEYNSLGTGRFC